MEAKMRKFFLALSFLSAISICVPGDYFIRITPNREPNIYQIRLNQVKTFRVTAYRKDTSRNVITPLEDSVWWEYDKRLLEKVSSTHSTIRLKAIREGVSELSATAIIKNKRCQKKMNILINK